MQARLVPGGSMSDYDNIRPEVGATTSRSNAPSAILICFAWMISVGAGSTLGFAQETMTRVGTTVPYTHLRAHETVLACV